MKDHLRTPVRCQCVVAGEGPEKVQKLHDSALEGSTFPKTVGGFINYTESHLSGMPALSNPTDWLVNVHSGMNGPSHKLFEGNPQMPKNLHLMCGDHCLDLLVGSLTTMSNSTSTLLGTGSAYK
jgi:hypothetical protein